jgi:hypothetical protein
MNKALGGYHSDERGHYVFSYSDSEGKHVDIRFRAESDYDLDVIFHEFRNFLIAAGHEVENEIGEIHAYDESHEDDDDDYAQSWGKEADDILLESIDAMKQHQSADKFSMESFPNNGWPFGGLTTALMPRLTTTDFASLTPNQFPTMAPITSQQVQSWTLSSMDIQALTSADLSRWSVPAPGTIGGAKVSLHGGGGILK